MKKLKSVHDSINTKNGRSEFFSDTFLEKKLIEKKDDVLLLFLPNFVLRTPFHYLILNEKFELFNRIAETLDGELFNECLENSETIDKIIEMFIYILENVTSYPRSALENIYYNLPVYEYDSSSDDSETGDIAPNRFIKNVQKIESFLKSVSQKVEQDKRYFEHNDFNF
jgi:predicted transcriptional regulator